MNVNYSPVGRSIVLKFAEHSTRVAGEVRSHPQNRHRHQPACTWRMDLPFRKLNSDPAEPVLERSYHHRVWAFGSLSSHISKDEVEAKSEFLLVPQGKI